MKRRKARRGKEGKENMGCLLTLVIFKIGA